MPITPAQAVQIITDRKLSLRPTRDNLWLAETATGTRLHKEAQATPLLAIELAEQSILSSEQREADTGNNRLISVLSTGSFYVKPRQDGNRTVFDAFLQDGSAIVEGKTTFSQAAVSAQTIVGGTGGTGATSNNIKTWNGK